MKVSKFQNVKITNAIEDLTPVNLATFDIEGNVVKTPLSTISRNVDGGFANSVYLSTQKMDGGNA